MPVTLNVTCDVCHAEHVDIGTVLYLARGKSGLKRTTKPTDAEAAVCESCRAVIAGSADAPAEPAPVAKTESPSPEPKPEATEHAGVLGGDWDEFIARMAELAAEKGCPAEQFRAGIARAVVTLGKKGKENLIPSSERAKLYAAIRDRAGHFVAVD